MSEIDPRTKMLIRTVGFIIILLGLASIYLGATSPNLKSIHLFISYSFGVITIVIGLYLIIANYEKLIKQKKLDTYA